MDINTLTEGLANPATFIPKLLEAWRPVHEYEAFKQYEPEHHAVNDRSLRPDKPVYNSVPDGYGGSTPQFSHFERVARIALAFQKLIVKRAAQFMAGGAINLTADTATQQERDLLAAVQSTWNQNKLRYNNLPLAKAVLSQLEAAEIWYSDADRDATGKVRSVKLRTRFYFPADGWGLLPVFDNFGDLIAFGLQYKDKLTDRDFLDLYTAEKLSKYVRETSYGWQLRENEILFGDRYGHKIPVVYYPVPKSAWNDVQGSIERLESLTSNLGDMNDYNGKPILAIKGEIKSMMQKGAAGGALEMEKDADVSYIEMKGKPESIISEHDMLRRFMFELTQTPDISFEAMKSLGDVSGVAFDRIMIDAHLKAKEGQEGWFGEGIQRRVNFLKAALREATPGLQGTDIEITPVFSLFKIDDEAERIENMLKANGGKPIISQQSSVAKSGLVINADEEWNKIEAESNAGGPEPMPAA